MMRCMTRYETSTVATVARVLATGRENVEVTRRDKQNLRDPECDHREVNPGQTKRDESDQHGRDNGDQTAEQQQRHERQFGGYQR